MPAHPNVKISFRFKLVQKKKKYILFYVHKAGNTLMAALDSKAKCENCIPFHLRPVEKCPITLMVGGNVPPYNLGTNI